MGRGRRDSDEGEVESEHRNEMVSEIESRDGSCERKVNGRS